MENASKALIMAATILIGVAILSLGVYLFTYFGNYAKGVEDENRANQIAQFNSQFLSYQGKDLTIYDVITLANMAKDYNDANFSEIGDVAYITISLTGVDQHFETMVSDFDFNNNINLVYSDANEGKLKKYSFVSYTTNDITKYIDTINIKGN